MQYSQWLCCCISGNSEIRFQWKFSCFLNNAHIRVTLITFSMWNRAAALSGIHWYKHHAYFRIPQCCAAVFLAIAGFEKIFSRSSITCSHVYLAHGALRMPEQSWLILSEPLYSNRGIAIARRIYALPSCFSCCGERSWAYKGCILPWESGRSEISGSYA